MLQKDLKPVIFILNQLFEIEKKVNKLNEKNSINRNIDRLKEFFEESYIENIGLSLHDPLGEEYSSTRTDIEANISGSSIENLIIVDVIKPIIRIKLSNNQTQLLQKGVVVVQSKDEIKEISKSKKNKKQTKTEVPKTKIIRNCKNKNKKRRKK